MEVKAAVAHQAGAPLTIETVKLDGPRAGEALVEMRGGVLKPIATENTEKANRQDLHD